MMAVSLVPRNGSALPKATLILAGSAWAGIPLGLGLARLLYEVDPLRFVAFGGWGPSLGIALAVTLVIGGLLWILTGRATRPHLSSLAPATLPWLYVLTPPSQVDPLRGGILIGGAIFLTLALLWKTKSPHELRADLIGGATVGLIALAAYLLTLQRVVGRADTFEFQVTAPVLGVAHPTGYPLYILLGKLFSLLPVGSVAARVNLTSSVAATTSVVLVFRILRRVLHTDRIVSALAALTFAFSPVFWSQAVIAEVYALHSAFAAAILAGALSLLAIGSKEVVEMAPPSSRLPAAPATILVTAALVGLSLTNHLTTVLLIPAVGLAILLARPRLSWSQWAQAAGLFLVALLIYVYIPLRWPALHEGRPMHWDEFGGWVTGSRFQGALQWRAWRADPARWQIVGRLLLEQFGWPGAILSGFGLGALVLRHWRAALVTALVFGVVGFYGLNYLVPDIAVFLIPMFLICALWIGFGISSLIQWSAIGLLERAKRLAERIFAQTAGFTGSLPRKAFRETPSPWCRAMIVTLLALLPLRLAWIGGPSFDWSDEQELEAWGRRVLALPLAEDSAILADSEKIAPLEYLHRIEGLRPDVSMVVLGTEEEYQANLRARLAAGQTVYLARFLPGLEGTYHLRSLGPLVEVGTAPLVDPPSFTRPPIRWQNGIALLGSVADRSSARPGEEVWLTLYWRSEQPQSLNTQARLRLVDALGRVVWQGGPVYAVSNRYPPVAWKGDEVIPDFHAIPIPYSLPPATYTVEVSLGPPFSQDIVPLADGAQWAGFTTLAIEPSKGRVPLSGSRTAVAFDGGALLAVSAPPDVPPGSPSELTATWLSSGTMSQAAYSLASPDSPAMYPVPTGLGSAYLAAGLDETGNAITWQLVGSRLRCGWLAPLSDACPLAVTRIAGTGLDDAIANFGNQMLLVEARFEAGRLQPGQSVDLTLVWQGLRSMEEDYTIFVHLLGPDGRVHGQIDMWPVQGTYPTSAWLAGEQVEDRYLVPLDSTAPSGSYQLEIGVYLLATNARLPILDEQGNPIDDKVLLGGLLVLE